MYAALETWSYDTNCIVYCVHVCYAAEETKDDAEEPSPSRKVA